MTRGLPVVIIFLLLLSSSTAPVDGSKTKRLRGFTSFRDAGKTIQKSLRADRCCLSRHPCCQLPA
uniref:Conotoxin n=1 Tax=Conus ermineus TaxID=55423 RepID=A0A346CIH0_CONER|nr:conotoxin precursor superfamily T [Conus ermineus]